MFVLFAYNTEDFTRQVESEIKVFVEFDLDATDEKIEEIVKTIKDMDHVKTVEHFTKEEGYKDFINSMKESNPETAAFFESTSDENPLPDSLIISADTVLNVDEIAKQVEKIEEIENVDYGEESTLSGFMSMTQSIRNGLGVVIIVLIILAIFLIQNTIRLTIFSRRHELAIMKLVGASPSQIVIPFLIEGLIIGLMGAFVPILITIYGYQTLYTALEGQLIVPMFKLITPLPFVYDLGFLIAVIAVCISFIGSFLAVFKHAVKA